MIRFMRDSNDGLDLGSATVCAEDGNKATEDKTKA